MSAKPMTASPDVYDVAVMGAGYAGLMAVLRLARSRDRPRVVLIGASDRFVERVRLQECLVTEVAPRISSISSFLAGTAIDFICGRIVSLEAARRRIVVVAGHRELEIAFDHAIYALGSSIDTDSVSGVADYAYRLEIGDGPRSAVALRARMEATNGQPVRVVIVGGAETGVEIAAEIKSACPRAEVTMISRSRCGGFKGPRVERVVRSELTSLGVRLLDAEIVAEVRRSQVVTSSGPSIPHDVSIWSGGLRSADVARRASVAVDVENRLLVDANLRSVSHPHILVVGDAAHPVAPTGAPYRLSAFTALASGAYAADAILAQSDGRQSRPFSFSTFGQGIALGLRGVGFFTYPDDEQRLFIVTGKLARRIRNVVWLVVAVLKLERSLPGFFFWPGRRRVSWQQANAAMREFSMVPQGDMT